MVYKPLIVGKATTPQNDLDQIGRCANFCPKTSGRQRAVFLRNVQLPQNLEIFNLRFCVTEVLPVLFPIEGFHDSHVGGLKQ